MNCATSFIACVVLVFVFAVETGAQELKPLPPAPGGSTKEPAVAEDPFAAFRDQKSDAAGQANPSKPRLQFPAEGFKGKPLVPLLPLNAEAQQPAENRADRGRVGNEQFRANRHRPTGVRPPVYLPGYNLNRPYGYPWSGYPSYGYIYPGYGFIYPGYGYGYGYGNGVWLPGNTGGAPIGGSNFFGNPHASQYMGNPHASQYMGNPHASQGP